jgi:hypothetical protein
MVDIPLAITTLTNAIKLASDLRGIEREFDVAEYKLKIADLTTLLADVKIALTDARMEHAAKDAEIERLASTARQAHREHRALARLARHGHVAAHHARELARDSEPEPSAAEALSRRGIGLAAAAIASADLSSNRTPTP